MGFMHDRCGQTGAAGGPPTAHANTHISTEDPIDGDKLDIDWSPVNYTPDDSITEADDPGDLSAHLKGIDTAIGSMAGEGEAAAICPQGRLYVPPAYTQTTGDAGFSITGAGHAIALRFCPEVDVALDSLSVRVKAVASSGNLSISLHEDGNGPEINGMLNASQTNLLGSQTSNSAPFTVAMKDKNVADAEAMGFECYKAFDGSPAADNGARSNAAPSATDPIQVTVDFGNENQKIINKFRITSFLNSDANVRAYPRAFTLWGSNLASPSASLDTDWTQLTGAVAWTAETDPGSGNDREYYVSNGTAYRHYRLKITDRSGTNAYVAIGELRLYQAAAVPVPAAELAALATMTDTLTNDTWFRATWPAVQLQRGKAYWIKLRGAVGANFSLSKRRLNTYPGAAHPDNTICMETDDSSVWTRSQQDNKPALLNLVLNSTVNHCPKLYYGRFSGQHIPLHDGFGWSMSTIPAAGLSLDCEYLSAPDFVYGYRVFAYDNSGTLGLSAEKVALTEQNGIPVKSGQAARRYLGLVFPIERQAGCFGPISVMDRRLVWNHYNRMLNPLGKPNPYATATAMSLRGDEVWRRLMNNDDWLCEFLCGENCPVHLSFGPVGSTGSGCGWAVGIDCSIPGPDQQVGNLNSGAAAVFNGVLAEGKHSAVPLVNLNGDVYDLYICYEMSASNVHRPALSGWLAI